MANKEQNGLTVLTNDKIHNQEKSLKSENDFHLFSWEKVEKIIMLAGLQHLRKIIVKKYGYGFEHTFFKSVACVRMANSGKWTGLQQKNNK